MKIPQWFQAWLDNDYQHLIGDVRDIKNDMRWVKIIGTGILIAIIGTAIAVIVQGGIK